MIRVFTAVLLPILPAFLVDLCLGDPQFVYHPVRVIGHIIAWSEKLLYKILPKSKAGEFVGGLLLAAFVPLGSVFFILIVLHFLGIISHPAALLADVFLCYQMIAAKSLCAESNRVKNALLQGDLISARKWLSYIVGRDTDKLTEEQIITATIETIAENTSDGVVAPLFYIGIGGAPLCYFYKAVNTLDSMVGYKNEKYRFFGTASAKLDDLLNVIPSRISGVLMIAASFLCGLDYKNAYTVYRNDRRKHASPNSAQTEAACSGALGIQMGGGATYGGVFQSKPIIGKAVKTPKPEDIWQAQKLMLVTSALSLACILLVRLVLFLILWR